MDGLLDRLMHWKSTGTGIGLAVVVLAVLKAMKCEIPDSLVGVLALIPAVQGALSKG